MSVALRLLPLLRWRGGMVPARAFSRRRRIASESDGLSSRRFAHAPTLDFEFRRQAHCRHRNLSGGWSATLGLFVRLAVRC